MEVEIPRWIKVYEIPIVLNTLGLCLKPKPHLLLDNLESMLVHVGDKYIAPSPNCVP